MPQPPERKKQAVILMFGLDLSRISYLSTIMQEAGLHTEDRGGFGLAGKYRGGKTNQRLNLVVVGTGGPFLILIQCEV